MRWAIPLSVSIHVGLIAAAFMVAQWKPEEISLSEAAVSIDIVSMEDAVTEATETISEESVNLVSAGVAQAASEPEETVEAEPVETAKPVAASTPVVAEEPPAEPVAPSDAPILERLDAAAKLAELQPVEDIQQITTASIAPTTPVEPADSTIPVKVANLAPAVEEVVDEGRGAADPGAAHRSQTGGEEADREEGN